MYKVKSLDEFINESFFKNLNVGERARVEAQLVEWSKQKVYGKPRIEPNSWTINDDLNVNVDGYVELTELDFKKLPVKFGKVTGYFSVFGCKNLTTLEGCPEEVGRSFTCDDCPKLTSLKNTPKKVGYDFYAERCGEHFTMAEVRKHCEVKYGVFV